MCVCLVTLLFTLSGSRHDLLVGSQGSLGLILHWPSAELQGLRRALGIGLVKSELLF